MIPQMQAQLKKAYSSIQGNVNVNKSGSMQELKFITPAQFNYVNNKVGDKEKDGREKKEKIVQNLKLLRNSDKFQW